MIEAPTEERLGDLVEPFRVKPGDKVSLNVLSKTSTKWAPWYVIPADHKWFMRLATGAVILHKLMEIDPQYPEVSAAQKEELIKQGAALAAGA